MNETILKNHNDDLVIEQIILDAQKKQLTFPELLGLISNSVLSAKQITSIAGGWGMTAQQVRNSIAAARRNAQLGGTVKTVWDFVDLQLAQWQCELISLGQFKINTPYDLGSGKTATENDLETLTSEERQQIKLADPKQRNLITLTMDLQVAADNLDLKYSKTQIMDAATRWELREWNIKSSELLSKLVYPAELDSDLYHTQTEPFWDEYVAAITADNAVLVKAALKHFVWQVKRKIRNLPVHYHMMPVFYGAQGGGKSTAIQKFCAPLGDFVASTDFGQITDTRNHALWNNYVLVVDEMGYSTTANLEDLKRKITEHTFESRVLGSHASTKVVNRATMIGSTNKDLARLIFDDTGMRRFFQINALARLERDTINNTNYLALWRSVNENAASPILEPAVFAAIQQRQEEYRHQSDIERWLRDRIGNKRLSIKIGIQQEYTGMELYQEYQQWEKDNGVQKLTSNTKFGRDIKDIPLVMKEINIEKVRNNTGIAFQITYTAIP